MPSEKEKQNLYGRLAQLVRVPVSHTGGHRFDSRIAHTLKLNIIKEKADQIIMNLPFSAYKFFKYALNIANNICIIHYYDMLKEDEIGKRVEFLKKIAIDNGFFLEGLDIHKIKTYAPREFYICIDITAKKMPM